MSTALNMTVETPSALQFMRAFSGNSYTGLIQNPYLPISPKIIAPPPREFVERYAEYKIAVEAILRKALEQAEPKNLFEPMQYILLNGGKRLRPILTMLACGAVGGNPFYAAMGGVVIEILHNFTLVHDDIMDDAPLRRGLPTIHTKWNSNVAILSGDALMAFAYQLLLKNYALAPRFTECIDIVTRSILEVCEGQVSDIEFQNRNDVTMAEYITMIEKKTARMLELSVALGTVLGNGTAQELSALRIFACSVGVAFQISDDILDITSSTEFGKTLGGDILMGKKTFLIIQALENRHIMNASDNALLDEFLQNRGLPIGRVKEMILLFERYGIIKTAKEVVSSYTQRAYKTLNSLPNNDCRTMLYQLSEALLARSG